MAIWNFETGDVWIAEEGQTLVTEDHIELGTIWPESLPQLFNKQGFRRQLANTTIRSQPEVGVPILRRRSTLGVSPFAGTMNVTIAQMAAIEFFYSATLYSGAFQFRFPAQDGTAEVWDCRFTAPPTFSPISHVLWQASIELERLP